MRARISYALLTCATVLLGLLSRSRAAGPLRTLPAWAEVGDALYGSMACFGLGVLAPRLRLRSRAVLALAWCWGIELSQAVHLPWLEHLRRTRLGGLVLGRGFVPWDLLAYVLGVGAAAATSWLLHERIEGSPSSGGGSGPTRS